MINKQLKASCTHEVCLKDSVDSHEDDEIFLSCQEDDEFFEINVSSSSEKYSDNFFNTSHLAHENVKKSFIQRIIDCLNALVRYFRMNWFMNKPSAFESNRHALSQKNEVRDKTLHPSESISPTTSTKSLTLTQPRSRSNAFYQPNQPSKSEADRSSIEISRPIRLNK
ncbi:hypothetical protein [Rickettsiella grylli]|uniref:Uncharacterized protein n=1 Tax=Rickettsiella grylli TaxID=59196 RepID=A8PM73_9COXI|nr:hypothetical protein [Rickettsiella grylli]EDP46639.1 hypothetical protein RICGR_0637 [Rickettsiella grylli]